MQLHNELRVPLKWRKDIASVSLLQRFVEMKIYQYACDMMWSGRSNCVDLLVRDHPRARGVTFLDPTHKTPF